MTITSFQVQNILRTYAKQLSRGQRLARRRMNSEAQPSDQVNISIEARRKQVIEKITAEIVSSIGYRVPGLGGVPGGLEDSALKRLSQEYGRSLDIGQDEDSGILRFMVRDPESGEVTRVLGHDESAELQDRLYVITQQIVDENMV
ncbi:MAG: DVU0524 family FlgM-associated protein [Pseudomonadota bacterium]